MGDARTLTAAQSHLGPHCGVPGTHARGVREALNLALVAKPQLPRRPTAASMSSQASICAMVAQMEAWLENLLFIAGNARAEAAHLQEQRQLARGAQAGHAEWRAQVLARAIRASWACRWSALGRSGAPAVPRGR